MYTTGQDIEFVAFYTSGGIAKSGLAVTCTVRRGNTVVANAQVATDNGGGWYSFTLLAANTATPGVYTAAFHTADITVDRQGEPAAFQVGVGLLASGVMPTVKDINQRIAKTIFGIRNNVYFVRPGGNDANDGLSWDTALLTPNKLGIGGTSPVADGDGIIIGGDVAITAMFRLPDGVKLRGGDRATARLRQTTAATNVLEVGSSCHVSDLRLNGKRGITNGGRAVNDTLIERVNYEAGTGNTDFIALSGALVRDTMIADCQSTHETNGILLSGAAAGSILHVDRYRGRGTTVGATVFNMDSGLMFARDSWTQSAGWAAYCGGGTMELHSTRLGGNPDVQQAGTGVVVLLESIGVGSGGSVLLVASNPAQVHYRDAMGEPSIEILGTIAAVTNAGDFTLSAEFPNINDAGYHSAIRMLSAGTNRGISRRIDTYTGATRRVTCRAFPALPAVGDRVAMIGVVE